MAEPYRRALSPVVEPGFRHAIVTWPAESRWKTVLESCEHTESFRGLVFLKGEHMRRLLTAAAVVVALSIPASVATVAVAGPAFAGTGITCTGLKGTITTTVTISKCTPSGGKGYKTASAPATDLATGGNITWKSSGATTTIGDASVGGGTSQGSCKKGNIEYTFTGQVTAASTTGTGIPAVGDPVSATACVETKNGKITLLKGTAMDL
jgi:opacity protein-like surface antigen